MAKLIVALDYTDALDALNMATTLRGTVEWLKVGMELFTREGPGIVQTINRMGFKVMLDLKFFDIPNTVAGGVRSAAAIHADLVTVHLMGGEKMCQAALEAAHAGDHKPLVYGVTVLTSMEQGDLPGYSSGMAELVTGLAAKASAWGLDGVVCSGQEVGHIKKANPSLGCLTPGIRPLGSNANDQRRIVTPGDAVRLGSDFLVVGRPVTQSSDPTGVAQSILEEIAQA